MASILSKTIASLSESERSETRASHETRLDAPVRVGRDKANIDGVMDRAGRATVVMSSEQTQGRDDMMHRRTERYAVAIGMAMAIGLATSAHAGLTTNWASASNLNLELMDGAYDGSVESMSAHTIGVAELGAELITDVNVTIAMDHTFVGDLTIKLRSPQGTMVTLLNRPGLPGVPDDGSIIGGDSSNLSSEFAITYDDNAQSGVFSEMMGFGLGSSDFIGDPANGSPDNYMPFPDGAEGDLTLSDLHGESASGNWTLYIGDSAAGTTGMLDSWSIELTTIPVPGGFAILGLAALTGNRRRREA